MKKLTIVAAGLGYNLLERNGMLEMAGLKFHSAPSVFPAVTCVAQASLRTGLSPAEHGMVSNGWWSEDLKKPLFWEQSSRIVKGRRVWADRRAEGGTVGMFFFQQSLGEEADVIVSPAPIHIHETDGNGAHPREAVRQVSALALLGAARLAEGRAHVHLVV